MGMFDNIVVDFKLPYITTDKEFWQTKSLDCTLDTYKITRKGLFKTTKMEPNPDYVPDETKTGMDALLDLSNASRLVKINELVNYTGEIRFYDGLFKDEILEKISNPDYVPNKIDEYVINNPSNNYIVIEYSAYFESGKLITLNLIAPHLEKII